MEGVMRVTVSLSSLTLLIVVGCSPSGGAPDLDAERSALLSADRAWFAAYSASDSPADAFVNQLVENAYLLPPDAPMAQGKEAIHAVIAELEGMPGFAISWTPAAAEVGNAADLGYTIGAYEMNLDGPEGPMTVVGKYLTVWQKQADGTWKVTADMFNADGPPTPHM
jgi:ketosteroid isomerase-like protein